MTTAIMFASLGSNSMKSPNPNSGFHLIHVAPCLDTSSQSPIRNQGGMVIVQSSFQSVATAARKLRPERRRIECHA